MALITQAAFGKSAALSALRDSGALAALCAARGRSGGMRHRGSALRLRRQLVALRLTVWRKQSSILGWWKKQRHKSARFALAGQLKSLEKIRCAWWRWADDLETSRSPFDFSRSAREARRIELAARLLNGSLIECALGACPPLPTQKYLKAARVALRAI